MKVLVLEGGSGPEREISLKMSASVQEALRELGYDFAVVDPAGGIEAVRVAAQGCDVALPMIPGVSGEDGSLQAMLDDIGIPYLGADAQVSKLCFDKAAFKELLRANGIATPAGQVVDAAAFENSPLVRGPFVLKPVADGSTIGCLIARELPYDAAVAQRLLAAYGKMLLEEMIIGDEITVPVLDGKALPVIEIVPPAGKEFDYENKYNGATAELCPPQNVSHEIQSEAQALAERIHRLAGVRHLSRTDMIVDQSGKLWVLEINTLPGMTKQSLFPKAASVVGISWPELVARFVELAKRG